jgi:2-aminoethylphosphonate-pyruvate transaminase
VSRKVDTALILAAGMGTRLGKLGAEIPKGFLELRGKPIVEESLAKLVAAGIRRVVVVTGHLARFYRRLAAQRPGLVETVDNPRYAELGSLCTLQVGLRHLGPSAGPLLLLESDLVYEPRALDEVLADPREDVILLSGPTRSGDEVWVETDSDGRLVAMSKDRGALGAAVAGELVGITRVSPALASLLAGLPPEGEYEVRGLVAAAAARPVWCRVVEDLQWAEIDDERHLQRARGLAVSRSSKA